MAIISQTIRTSGAEIDLLQLFGHLVDESRRLKYRDDNTEMAMPLTHNKGKSKSKYSYCKRIGHLEDKCWEKHPELKKEGLTALKKSLKSSQK